jgi:hypothetical protein
MIDSMLEQGNYAQRHRDAMKREREELGMNRFYYRLVFALRRPEGCFPPERYWRADTQYGIDLKIDMLRRESDG